jgi:hypothetical protein
MRKERITALLQGIIAWLAAHRMVNGALVLAYAAFILFAHDHFVQLSIRVMHALTLPVYNSLVAMLVGVCGGAFFVVLLLFLKKETNDRGRKLGYLVAILILLVLHHLFLFEMNIEVIHAMQFAVLALLLFPLTQRFGAAIIMSIPFMILDEWHQFQVLYPTYVQYFEFNDMLMDILGCSLLMCGLWIMGVRELPSARPWYLRAEAMVVAVLAVGALLAMTTCIIVPFPQDACATTWLVLNTLPDPTALWQTHPFTGRMYHAMQPVEGMVVVVVVALVMLGMGEREMPGQA